MTFVKPRSVPRPDIVRVRPKKLKNLDLPTQERSPISTQGILTQESIWYLRNWSGFQLRAGGSQPEYDYVMGQWNVPALVGSERGDLSSMSMWVGLDSDRPDLVQAGTEVQDTVMNGMHVFSYFAWHQFLPQQQVTQQLAGFDVNPNDEMFVTVSLAPFEAEFFFGNLTTNHSTVVPTSRGSTRVHGTEVERPMYDSVFGDLADYGSAVMSAAYARLAGRPRGYVAYQGGTNVQITMLEMNTILSTVTPIDGASMRFTWRDFTGRFPLPPSPGLPP